MKSIAILGSTGSIGRQCLSVVESLPGLFDVVALAAGSNVRLAAEQVKRHRPKLVSLATETAALELCEALKTPGRRKADSVEQALPDIVFGEEGIERVATHPEADTVLSAAVGVVGLRATYQAIEHGKNIALANKEVLVAAGEVVMAAVARRGVSLLPVDSEHNAIHQCLRTGVPGEVKRLVLTASGGPFRKTPLSRLAKVTPKQALAHPNWKMGQRITIDSATLMNKALEVIEARWLFGLDPDRIEVIIHPESVIHSFVEFTDGSILAQLSPPDMRLPIQYALTWPDRLSSPARKLNWKELQAWHFEQPDPDTFLALQLGYEVARRGGTCGAVLNAANEAAVSRFLAGDLPFLDIARACRDVLAHHHYSSRPTMAELLAADRWARQEVARWRTRTEQTARIT